MTEKNKKKEKKKHLKIEQNALLMRALPFKKMLFLLKVFLAIFPNIFFAYSSKIARRSENKNTCKHSFFREVATFDTYNKIYPHNIKQRHLSCIDLK